MDRADQADVDQDQNTAEVLRFTYHQQALGWVTEITAPAGGVVEWVTYDVYGQPTIRNQQGTVVSQSPVGNPYLFVALSARPRAQVLVPSAAGTWMGKSSTEGAHGLSPTLGLLCQGAPAAPPLFATEAPAQ